MTGLRLARWPRFARAPRLDHVEASIRGTSSSSSSGGGGGGGSQKIATPTTFSRGLTSTRNFAEGVDANRRKLPEPTMFGNGQLSKRFDSGHEIAAFYRAQKMKPALHMKNIRVPQFKIGSLTVQVSQSHCFDSNHMKYLDKAEHPLRKTIFDMYAGWADRPLWYSGAGFGAAPIVCSKAKRWIQRGLREALLERGYDRDGRVVQQKTPAAGGGAGNSGGRKTPPALYGTLKVLSHSPKAMCSHTFPQVLAAMRQAVAAAEPHLTTDGFARKPGPRGPNYGSGNSFRSPRASQRPPIGKARAPRI
ncbi:uncharacterized protein PG986_008056 [Apiospora aurea]|uniref:Uncharacterized protein n=1 Tax=Apiospora aurea TaxID=335848 RepID=A0ABR1QEC0_9PEZI